MNVPVKLNWREWELNPVVVKELRQAVRSWAVTGMLLLFILVLFCTMVSVLVFSSVNVGGQPQALGREVFAAFSAILTATSLVFIPLYVAVRLAAERQEHNVDLLYITTLSPARIIRGKLMCGIYLTVLFFSVCMPFVVFTNLLRGVDLPTIFVALGMVFLLSVLSIQLAIFFACLPATKGFKVLLAIPTIIMGFMVTGMMSAAGFGMMMSGVGSTLGTWTFWGPALTGIFVGTLAFGLLHVSSVALISPPSANRSLPVRLYVTGAWIVGGVVAVSWFLAKGWSEALYSWASPAIALSLCFMILALSEGDERSVRVARTIPENRLRREVAFFLFNGTAGGFLWASFLFCMTVGLSAYFSMALSTTASRSDDVQFIAISSAIFLYAVAYCLAGLWIHRRFMPQRAPMTASLLAALLPAAWAVVPNFVLFFANKLTWDTLQQRQLGNVFNVFSMKDDSKVYDHLYFASCFALAMILLNLRWFVRQARAFKPYRREDAAKPPPLPN